MKIDEDRRPGCFILTGSQNFPPMQGIAGGLARRCGILDMLNLSAAEVREAFDPFDENAFILKGGFRNSMKDPISILSSGMPRTWEPASRGTSGRFSMWEA